MLICILKMMKLYLCYTSILEMFWFLCFRCNYGTLCWYVVWVDRESYRRRPWKKLCDRRIRRFQSWNWKSRILVPLVVSSTAPGWFDLEKGVLVGEGRKASKNYAWWYWLIHVCIFIFIYMIWYDMIWYDMRFDMVDDMTNDKYDVWYRSMIWYTDMICDMTCSLQYRYINLYT